MAFDPSDYNRNYYRKNRKRLKAASKRAYKKLRATREGREKLKLRRELRHYGVPQSVIFRKTGGKCHFCGRKATVVHHLDGDGRTNERRGESPGKDPNRLVPSCRACHLDLHRAEIALSKRTRQNGYWSRSFERCIECGRDDRKHAGHGLCVNCTANRRNRERRERRGPGV